jgi:hypothetical protein
MKAYRILLSGALALGAGSFLAGCADDYEGYSRIGVSTSRGPLYGDYQPGYYYDEAYTDGFGSYYPRTYYYYDGHHWQDRDDVPHGYIAQRRHEREEHETRVFREDRDHHGQHRDGDRDDIRNRGGDDHDSGHREDRY